MLLLLVAVYLGRILGTHLGWTLDLGGGEIAALRPETRSYLARLEGRVSLTCFISSRDVLPTSMKGVENALRSLLQAFNAAAPDITRTSPPAIGGHC
ncbi:MAG: hypothetical protein FJ276_18870 [Planctomycetes bacterium]|nr:hypothetical protein [Planctomycetota bacterium]